MSKHEIACRLEWRWPAQGCGGILSEGRCCVVPPAGRCICCCQGGCRGNEPFPQPGDCRQSTPGLRLHVAMQVVSVDVSVDPPSYGVAFLAGSMGVRETEASRLRARRPGEAPPQAAPPAKLLEPAALANGSAALAGVVPHAPPVADAATPEVEEDGFGDFCEAPGSVDDHRSAGQHHGNGHPAMQEGCSGRHAGSSAAEEDDDFGDFSEAAPAGSDSCAGQQPHMLPFAGLANGHSSGKAASSEQSWAAQTNGCSMTGGSHDRTASSSTAREVSGDATTLTPADLAHGSMSFAPVWGTHHGSIPAAPETDAYAAASWHQQPSALDRPDKGHRFTPTSVLSVGPSDDDSEFGDFEAAAQIAAAAALDRCGALCILFVFS
jgi:hypothetical protein